MMNIRFLHRAGMGMTVLGLGLVCGGTVLRLAQAEASFPDTKRAARPAVKSNEGADDGSAVADLNALSLQVEALKGLYRLDARTGQLPSLAKLAHGAAAKLQPRPDVKASAKYVQALTDLRDALLKKYDEDLIDTLSEKLDEIRDAEDLDLDEEAEITDVARERAPQAARSFNIRQVIRYSSLALNEVSDPLERILATIKEGAESTPEEVIDLHALRAEEVGWLVAGLDVKKAEKVQDQAAKLFKKAHRIKNAELQATWQSLYHEASQIVGKLQASDVLRHYMEHSLAELLSNPQFEAAINARLQNMKK